MRELEKTIAALCAVLFIVTSVLSLLLFNIERKAFTSITYKQAFEEQRLYERMPALLASALQGSISQNASTLPFLGELTVQDWQLTISSVLPPDQLRAMTDAALDSTFDYVNFRTNSVVISIVPIKAQLAGESGISIVRRFLSTQPACTVEQLTQMAFGLLGGEVALCNPPEEAIGLFAPFIQSQLQALTTTFPDELTLIPVTQSGSPDDPRLQLHVVRSLIRFSPFFVFLLLLAVAVFGVRTFRDLFVWWGWPLLIAGATTALIGMVAAPIVGLALQFVMQTQGLVLLPPLLASTIAETASAVAVQMLVPVAIQGFILAAIGLLMVIIGVFLTRRQHDQMLTSW